MQVPYRRHVLGRWTGAAILEAVRTGDQSGDYHASNLCSSDAAPITLHVTLDRQYRSPRACIQRIHRYKLTMDGITLHQKPPRRALDQM